MNWWSFASLSGNAPHGVPLPDSHLVAETLWISKLPKQAVEWRYAFRLCCDAKTQDKMRMLMLMYVDVDVLV
jgi:hypothetical protein